MINQFLKDLEKIKSNITEEFKFWFQFSVDMATSVGVSPSVPRIAKYWSRFRNNVPGEDNESCYRRAIGIPVMNTLITNLDVHTTNSLSVITVQLQKLSCMPYAIICN